VADLEHENVVSTRAHENGGGEFADVVSARFDARKGEREGLPPGYRMRADAHYVDQLSARSGEVPLRLIAIDDIDSPDVDSSIAASALQPLTSSSTRMTYTYRLSRISKVARWGMTTASVNVRWISMLPV